MDRVPMKEEKTCLDTLVDLANQNRHMLQVERERNAQLKQIQQKIGYLVDSAVLLPGGDGSYIVSAKSFNDLLAMMVTDTNGLQ